jgi:hypothetical protein
MDGRTLVSTHPSTERKGRREMAFFCLDTNVRIFHLPFKNRDGLDIISQSKNLLRRLLVFCWL